jgi:hypothetical protein
LGWKALRVRVDPGYFRACHYLLTIKSMNMKTKIFGIGAFVLIVGVLHHPSICPFHHSKSLIAHHTATPPVKDGKMMLVKDSKAMLAMNK